jgi:hypothetical protein
MTYAHYYKSTVVTYYKKSVTDWSIETVRANWFLTFYPSQHITKLAQKLFKTNVGLPLVHSTLIEDNNE